MNDFWLWFNTGLEHIADWNGYDHMLFLLALCGVYDIREWKKILILITAFTIGHSLTLAFSVLNIFHLPSDWVEFLIPVTIFITCIQYVAKPKNNSSKKMSTTYLMALLFGFIHGMGFSTLLRAMLGNSSSIAVPLFYFNLGIEAGQILIVISILLFSLILTGLFKIASDKWKFYLSSAVSGIALMMMVERCPL